MRAPVAIAALLVGLLSVASPAAQAGTPPVSVETLTARVDARVARWQQARAQRLAAQAAANTLATRVEALKRAKARPGAAAGELERLLQASVVAERTLAQALTDEADARAEVERAVRGGVGRVDREIRARVPGLKAGPLPERQETARQINALRAARQHLRDAAASLGDDAPAPRKDWARYQVKVEPLDGPSELNEKADFVEDTRDKLKKKRFALARLLQEAKQEREIARAARDFDTYVRLFDEEARTDRVTRQAGTGATAERANGDDLASAPESQAPTSPSTGGTQNNGVPTAGLGNESSNPPPGTEPGRGSTDGFNQTPNDSTASPNPDTGGKTGTGQLPASPAVGVPTAEAGSVARDINAELLINLRVDELAAQGLDMATLERLVEELEALDGFLDHQAKAIRQRARSIEAEDAESLGP